jgi:protein-tyrosine phosphatase
VGGDRPLTVLAVCTGNVCRSPAVQALLEARLPADVVVSSAGTRALVGAPVAAPMAELVKAAGGDTDGIRARQLTPAMVAGADLVLALTREHRSAVLTLEPRALQRTFTLLELAALLGDGEGILAEQGTADRFRARIKAAAAARGGRRLPPGADDVEDPFGRELAVYRAVAAQIEAAVDTLVAAFPTR